MKKYTTLILLPLILLSFNTHIFAQSPRIKDAGELAVALQKLTVLGSALYIAAHPDDENTAVLAYLAKGRCVRTGYLAITRGEGGQNLIGPEQGGLMGIIRTQELLAARRIDGAEQFFTRAIDFGFSKNSEETMNIWGRENTLEDVVWVIRRFRPDVVIARFTPTQGGHGNHTGSAILAEEAFRAAGDSSRFPEQLKHVQPWQPKRLVWNVFRFQQSPVAAQPEHSVALDLGTYSPLLGRSFTELAGLSRSMHKSQGFGAAENRGTFQNYFQHTAGEQAQEDLFDGVNLTWSRVRGGEVVGKFLEEANRAFRPHDPTTILPLLLKAYAELNKVEDTYWREVKRKELLDVIQSCGGIWIDALTSDYSASPGEQITVTATLLNRSRYPFKVASISLPLGQKDTTLQALLEYNKGIHPKFLFRIPTDVELSQPYWLREKSDAGLYHLSDLTLVGMPENQPSFVMKVAVMADTVRLEWDVPFRYRWIDPVEGELYRPFVVVPPAAVTLREPVFIFPNLVSRHVEVVLKSGAANVIGTVRLTTPAGWNVKPDAFPFEMKTKYEEQVIAFQITPANGAQTGNFSVEANVAGQTINQGIRTLEYNHIPPQIVFPKAEGKLVRVNLKKNGQTIGYIMGAGDEIPATLRQIGYNVILLADEELAEGDFSKYDAIVVGVRAYNTRPNLRMFQKKLLNYVQQGGTYIVQYVTTQRGESEHLGPYPFNVSRERVTVEEAPMIFLQPNHPLLNVPNKITDDDFKGWVQERGLYFADTWDPSYETVLACNDPGEKPLEGGLLIARYGRGRYIYTGLAFFRQLPAGVPGAIRLFANMVSKSLR